MEGKWCIRILFWQLIVPQLKQDLTKERVYYKVFHGVRWQKGQ